MALKAGQNQVNLLLLLLQEQGDLASTPIGDEEPYDMREIRSLANWKKHNLCLSIYYTIYNYNYIVATGRTDDKPTVSLRTDDNGTPATWTFGLVFQQAIDRQDRTTN